MGALHFQRWFEGKFTLGHLTNQAGFHKLNSRCRSIAIIVITIIM
jgi:hypothetical protein